MSAPNRLRKILVVLVAVAALAACSAVGVTNPLGGDRITVTAKFDNANGLYVGNPVDVLGISVGKVVSIKNSGAYVLVEMSLDEDIKIPANAQAVTVSTSILTDRHVELTPPYTEGPAMRDKDVIGLDRTRTPVEFDRILSMVEKLSSELEGDTQGDGPIADLVAVSSALTEGNGQSIRDALGSLEEALRLSADGGVHSREQFTAIVDNLASLSQAAAGNDAQIRQLGSGIAQISEFLAGENLGFGTTGADFNTILEETTALLIENRDSIRTTLAGTSTVTGAMNDYQRELSEFFDVAPMLMDNVYNAIDQEAGALRVHGLLDKLVVDGQLVKEMCNVLGLRQLGCQTGTLQDFGPDFGASSILAAMVEKSR